MLDAVIPIELCEVDGDKVKIFYDPSNPDSNEVDGLNHKMAGFGLIGVGVLIVLIATIFMAIVVNIIPDYLSLLETRIILNLMNKTKIYCQKLFDIQLTE